MEYAAVLLILIDGRPIPAPPVDLINWPLGDFIEILEK